MGEVSKEALRLVRWLDENDCTSARWLNGWRRHECSGPTGSIIVSEAAWNEARPFFEPNPALHPSLFRLTEAGRAALKGGPNDR
jgi:hypothetical protein